MRWSVLRSASASRVGFSHACGSPVQSRGQEQAGTPNRRYCKRETRGFRGGRDDGGGLVHVQPPRCSGRFERGNANGINRPCRHCRSVWRDDVSCCGRNASRDAGDRAGGDKHRVAGAGLSRSSYVWSRPDVVAFHLIAVGSGAVGSIHRARAGRSAMDAAI
jgi:hypothetical protein